MSGVSPYDSPETMEKARKEAPTCLNCTIPGGCDDTHPDCPMPAISRKSKRKFRSRLVANIAKADGGVRAAAVRKARHA